jgi:ABC-2 type transport system ATP-binding protein
MADRISVLHRGRIIGTLQPAAVDLERRFFDLVLQFDMQEQEQR